ncbi:MAG: pentapeptide repeat-containing protein [Desulfobacteraceae bacterium]|nr:pentapeptide repeat-containing protein [Desulfobacteraceae bacterium]
MKKFDKRRSSRPVYGPVAAAAALFVTVAALVVGGSMLWFRRNAWPEDFAERLIVQAYGSLFVAALLLGVGMLWFFLRRRRRDIGRLQEIIDDFRDWNSLEAAYRIAGCIRRLNRFGVGQMDLSRCTLRHMHLREAGLAGARMVHTRLRGAVLSMADLHDADLNGADLRGAFLWKSRLSGAILSFADLRGANLEHADCRGALLQGVRLEGARVGGCDLTGVQGLEPEQLSGTVGWEEAKLDPDLARRMESRRQKPQDLG